MHDKYKHFGVCLVGTIVIGSFLSPLAGMTAMFIVGSVKELYDERPGGSGFDLMDIGANSAGCLVGYGILMGIAA